MSKPIFHEDAERNQIKFDFMGEVVELGPLGPDELSLVLHGDLESRGVEVMGDINAANILFELNPFGHEQATGSVTDTTSLGRDNGHPADPGLTVGAGRAEMRLTLKATGAIASLLPRQARERSFIPYYEELLGQFVEDSAKSGSPEEFRRIRRRFRRSVALALASGWRALLVAQAGRGIRWLVVAALGDGALRLFYWLVFEILRRG